MLVSELLADNLYEFGRHVRESELEPFFTLPRLKRISHQVLTALEYVHSLDLIHCDIKPENIVMSSYSRCNVKLIDFGSSCFTTDRLTSYIQSRSYRAPEVILNAKYDQRIDVWSYGAVLAELLTGNVLFQNDSVASMLARITGKPWHAHAHIHTHTRTHAHDGNPLTHFHFYSTYVHFFALVIYSQVCWGRYPRTFFATRRTCPSSSCLPGICFTRSWREGHRVCST